MVFTIPKNFYQIYDLNAVRIIVDSVTSQGGIGRTAGDAPEIDGIVHILPSDKPSKRYRPGELIKVTIVDAQGHDLVAQM